MFISYSTKDKTIADAVCAKLEEAKIRVWIAPRDVPAGSNFAASLIGAVNTCKVFVLIWSASANTSKHILNEINQAFDQGIIIIPFRIQDIQSTDEMRYYFGRTHWLDAIDPPLEKHIAILRNTILINLGREPHPSASTPVFEESPVEAAEHLTKPSRQKKRLVEAGAIQRSKALPANITKFIPFATGGVVVLTLVVLFRAYSKPRRQQR